MVYAYQQGMHAAFSSVAPTNLTYWEIEFKESQVKNLSSSQFSRFLLPFSYDNETFAPRTCAN